MILNMLKRPAYLLAFFFISSFSLSASLSGYGFEAWGKAYLEAIIISLASTIILIRSVAKNTYFSTPDDKLLLVPALGYFLFWYFDHYTGASAVIHPIVIFTSLFAAVAALRQFSRNGRNAIAIILIMGACGVALLYLCDFRANAFWLNMTVNGDHLSFPLLRWLQHGGFAQRNVFGTFIASSALLAFHFSIRFWKTNNKIANKNPGMA